LWIHDPCLKLLCDRAARHWNFWTWSWGHRRGASCLANYCCSVVLSNLLKFLGNHGSCCKCIEHLYIHACLTLLFPFLLHWTAGTALQSLNSYLFGSFRVDLKLVPNDSAGVLSSFYVSHSSLHSGNSYWPIKLMISATNVCRDSCSDPPERRLACTNTSIYN
jgi:hypothetical protein